MFNVIDINVISVASAVKELAKTHIVCHIIIFQFVTIHIYIYIYIYI